MGGSTKECLVILYVICFDWCVLNLIDLTYLVWFVYMFGLNNYCKYDWLMIDLFDYNYDHTQHLLHLYMVYSILLWLIIL